VTMKIPTQMMDVLAHAKLKLFGNAQEDHQLPRTFAKTSAVIIKLSLETSMATVMMVSPKEMMAVMLTA